MTIEEYLEKLNNMICAAVANDSTTLLETCNDFAETVGLGITVNKDGLPYFTKKGEKVHYDD